MSNSLRVGAALLLAVLAVWAVQHAALHQPLQLGAKPIATLTAASQVAVNGEAPASADAPYAMVKIPDRLPDFTLANRDGKPTSISAWRGKSLILNFWATWCAPCRREIPILESLDVQWKPQNVAVIGIAVDHRDEVLAFAAALHITYPLLIGEQDALDAAAAVGVDSPVFPFTVFTDRRGEVVAVFVGELHRPQADLILSTVKDIDDDRIALPAARRAIAAGLDTLNGHAAG